MSSSTHGAPHGPRPVRRRIRHATAAGRGDRGGSPAPALSRRGRGTAPGSLRRPGAVTVVRRSRRPGPGAASEVLPPVCHAGDADGRHRPAAQAAGTGGGGYGVGRRHACRAAGRLPLSAPETAAAPSDLSPLPGAPGWASIRLKPGSPAADSDSDCGSALASTPPIYSATSAMIIVKSD
jgi:hypothetical protein